jgi:acyl carrier protein
MSLQLGPRADQLEITTQLMGNFPELNSLTVMGIVSGIEEQTGVTVSDQEITAEIFETVGTLVKFIEQKVA